MKKLYKGTAKYSFGESGHFWLPDLLNHYGVGVEAFRKGALATLPELTKVMITHLRPELRHKLRHYRKKFPKADARTLMYRVTPTMKDAREMVEQIKELAEKCITDYHLYQDGDKVKSEIVGTFSFADPYLDNVSDYYTTWECPECKTEEREVSEDEPTSFHPVSGPYYRCEECDHIVRPKVGECEEPNDGEDWDYYTDHLSSLVEDLGRRCADMDLPEPDGLHVSGTKIDWRGRDGHINCGFDGVELAEAMTVNGDFFISDGQLYIPQKGTPYMSCVMAHHDASPSMVIQPLWRCEMGEHEVVGDEVYEHSVYSKATEELLCGDHHLFGSPTGTEFKVVSKEGFQENSEQLQRDVDAPEGHPINTFFDLMPMDSEHLPTYCEALNTLIMDYLDSLTEEDAA